METLELTREKTELAPSSSFTLESSNEKVWKNLASTYQFQATEEEFTSFLQEFSQLYQKYFVHDRSEPMKKSLTKLLLGQKLSLVRKKTKKATTFL